MGEPTEACRLIGNKGYMPLMNQIRGGGHMPLMNLK